MACLKEASIATDLTAWRTQINRCYNSSIYQVCLCILVYFSFVPWYAKWKIFQYWPGFRKLQKYNSLSLKVSIAIWNHLCEYIMDRGILASRLRHDSEAIFALMALREGNTPVTGPIIFRYSGDLWWGFLYPLDGVILANRIPDL